MIQEHALNLQPGDEIELNGEWWAITQHSVAAICLAGTETGRWRSTGSLPKIVMLQLRSVEDAGHFISIETATLHRFNFRRACGY